jgi:hypothetical protein
MDALAQHIARGSGDRSHDGGVITGQTIEETRLARIRAAGDDDRHALAQQAALARAFRDGIELIAHFLQMLGKRRIGKKINFFFRKVDGCFNVGPQGDERLGHRLDHDRELALERAHGRARRLARSGINEIGNRLRLRQIEFVVEERALRELARQRAPRPELKRTRNQFFLHDGTAVSLQLEHVLAGVRLGGGKEKR